MYALVPEGKENILSQRLTRPMGLLSAGSTPRSTPRSTPIRSLSPAVSRKSKKVKFCRNKSKVYKGKRIEELNNGQK